MAIIDTLRERRNEDGVWEGMLDSEMARLGMETLGAASSPFSPSGLMSLGWCADCDSWAAECAGFSGDACGGEIVAPPAETLARIAETEARIARLQPA